MGSALSCPSLSAKSYSDFFPAALTLAHRAFAAADSLARPALLTLRLGFGVGGAGATTLFAGLPRLRTVTGASPVTATRAAKSFSKFSIFSWISAAR